MPRHALLQRWKSALILLLAALLLAGPVAAAETDTVLIVLDGSGSMWRAPDGERRAKFVLARDGIRSALATAASRTRFGLLGYGHRRSGDCGDVETLVKPDADSSDRITAALERINPRGRGPVTAALREAASHLPADPEPAKIVLIVDDMDNCQLDPCSVLESIKARNTRTRIDVVALAVRAEDAQQLRCLPQATGGKMYEVVTAAQIAVAIEDAFAPDSPPPASPKASTPPTVDTGKDPAIALSRPGLHLSARLAGTSSQITRSLRWRVLQRTPSGPRTVWEGDAATPVLDLEGGSYEIEAWQDFVRATGTVEVTKGIAQAHSIVLAAGVVQFPVPASDAARELVDALAESAITLRRIDGGAETLGFQRGVPAQVSVSPGNYTVTLTHGAQRLERTFAVVAGQTIPFLAGSGLGAIEISVPAAGGGRTSPALVVLYEDDPDAQQGRREVWRSGAVPARAILPAGIYLVMARRGGLEVRERVVVKAGELGRRSLALEAARVSVSVRVVGGRLETPVNASTRLERLDGDKEVFMSAKTPAEFEVAAGRYRVEGRLGAFNLSAGREIDVRAGARQDVTVEIAAGEVRLRWNDQGGSPQSGDLAWEIRDSSGRIVWLGAQGEARALLAAGTYTVRAETRERRMERSIDIAAGESRLFEFRSP